MSEDRPRGQGKKKGSPEAKQQKGAFSSCLQLERKRVYVLEVYCIP